MSHTLRIFFFTKKAEKGDNACFFDKKRSEVKINRTKCLWISYFQNLFFFMTLRNSSLKQYDPYLYGVCLRDSQDLNIKKRYSRDCLFLNFFNVGQSNVDTFFTALLLLSEVQKNGPVPLFAPSRSFWEASWVRVRPATHRGKGNILIREYELITEAHAQLSAVRNCSRSSLRVCLGEGKQLAGGGRSAVAGDGGRQTVHRERESGAVSNDRKLSVGFCY